MRALSSAPASTRLVYVTLGWSDQFDERAYQSLVNPQAFARSGRDIWVRRATTEGKRLEMLQPGGGWRTIDVKPYKVRQTGGAELGYVIEPAKPDEVPDIEASEVVVPSSGDVGRLVLRVADTRTGNVDPGVVRHIVLVRPAGAASIWGWAAVPLVIGILVSAVRRFR